MLSTNLSNETTEEQKWIVMDRAYVTPPTITRVFQDNEKLVDRKNYKSWSEMVRLDLQAYNLLPFIEERLAETKVQVSPHQRKALDAMTVQYLRSSMSRAVLMTLGTTETAYDAMVAIQKKLWVR